MDEEGVPSVTFRTGDTILHKPSGETWTVAWGDDREVICCGWPESFADASDCEMLQTATDEEHWTLVRRIAEPNSSSPRTSRCWHLLECAREAECIEVMHL